MADILNRLSPEQAEDMLTSLAEVKPEQAAVLRSKMFSFADIAKLSVKARSTLFDKVPNDQMALALRGSNEALQECVLSVLGARARRLVENELNSGSAAQKDVDAARRIISGLALDMVGRGDIELSVPDAGA